ncbi:MAG: hypothetical protein GY778_06575 [bacterium]|nr:hypothetical protein [bacterium]
MKERHVGFSALLIAPVLLAVTASPDVDGRALVGTGFTFQGKLEKSGLLVNGLTDFEFTLWDTGTGGNQVGPTLTFDGQGGNPSPVNVVNGMFTVVLDFGDVFDGQARWLDVAARFPSGSAGAYGTLSPRQELTPTPHALHAVTAETALGGLQGSGTTGHVAKFTGPDAIGDSVIYESDGKIGIGTTSPATPLQVAGGALFDGLRSSASGTFPIGVIGEGLGANAIGGWFEGGDGGIGVYGEASGTDGKAGYFEGDVTANGVVESASGGFKFPDGSTQTTAFFGSGVPSGYYILGDGYLPPPGYTYVEPLFPGNTWETRLPMPGPRRAAAAAEVNGSIHVLGGDLARTTHNTYDPRTNVWHNAPDMPTGRIGLAAAAVNGKIYAIGGWDGSYLPTVEEYDPGTGTWMTRASMQVHRSGLAAVAVDGKIYAIGGDHGPYLYYVEEYDPVSDTWTLKAYMPTARTRLAAVAVNGKIYAIGGYDGSDLATVEEYDPVTDRWASKADMPTGRRDVAAVAVNGKIFAIGGYDSGFVAAVEEYDPAADMWRTGWAEMLTARASMAAAAVNGRIYVMGGHVEIISHVAVNEAFTPYGKYSVFRKD